MMDQELYYSRPHQRSRDGRRHGNHSKGHLLDDEPIGDQRHAK